MSCYHPNKAFKLGVKENGKLDLMLRSYSVDHLEMVNGKWQNAYSSFVDPRSERTVKDFIEVPCGKCLGCRMNYSKQWADRMMLEMQDHKESYFLTLTYNDDHIPYRPGEWDSDTGEVPDDAEMNHSLKKRDLQLFIKRLRKKVGDDHLMYFACGEYGEHTKRPHYHLIVFGLHLDDLQYFKKSNLGFNYYTSEFLNKVWSIYDSKTKIYDPIGHVIVATATWETCAYTARYVTKKADNDLSDFYRQHNIVPEFCTMSRNPAIAKNAFMRYIESDNVCYANFSSIPLKTEKGGKLIQIPKYWDRLAEKIIPEIVAQKKLDRQMYAQENNLLKLENTDLSYLDQLAIEENNLDARLRSLERNKI